MSVPQTAVRCTLISTSSSPAVGIGASISSSPSAGLVLARAFMVWVMCLPELLFLIHAAEQMQLEKPARLGSSFHLGFAHQSDQPVEIRSHCLSGHVRIHPVQANRAVQQAGKRIP